MIEIEQKIDYFLNAMRIQTTNRQKVTLARIGRPDIVEGTPEFERLEADYFRDSEFGSPYPGQVGGTNGSNDKIPQLKINSQTEDDITQLIIFLQSTIPQTSN